MNVYKYMYLFILISFIYMHHPRQLLLLLLDGVRVLGVALHQHAVVVVELLL